MALVGAEALVLFPKFDSLVGRSWVRDLSVTLEWGAWRLRTGKILVWTNNEHCPYRLCVALQIIHKLKAFPYFGGPV